jgi:hypothetical protein
MDHKIVIQLLTNKTEEIQNLLAHFAKQPDDVSDSIELLETRIHGLSKDFEILKKNCEAKPEDDFLVESKKEEITPIAPKCADEKLEKPEIVQENKATIQAEPKIVEEKIETTQELPIVEEAVSSEHIQLIGEKAFSHKLKDIQSAIGINDRFLFTRELFENSTDQYNSAISFINQADCFESIQKWMESEKQWDFEDPTVAQFIDITKRKF